MYRFCDTFFSNYRVMVFFTIEKALVFFRLQRLVTRACDRDFCE